MHVLAAERERRRKPTKAVDNAVARDNERLWIDVQRIPYLPRATGRTDCISDLPVRNHFPHGDLF